ncbi:hypothetical protein [Nostoc sp. FACHB-110]|uniref:hypothetical protein n=1 Tax=Nostoc sp. FACHB-110 TaxID=2692834 RepID=UPI001681E294|nr:hypothetical protein [Nostoc sp. FACHB-110]MBD2438749.1 hypothetical protein [Nostoc sp. FACHB-110]
MKEQLEKRLAELKAEFASGQKVMADFEVQQANLRDKMLRISGAIQVLEEELGNFSTESNNTQERELSHNNA